MADEYIRKQAAIDALEDAKKIYVDRKLIIAKMQDIINNLPSAQPEVIRCKDCKWKQGSECVRFADVRPFPDDYCSRAERKEA